MVLIVLDPWPLDPMNLPDDHLHVGHVDDLEYFGISTQDEPVLEG